MRKNAKKTVLLKNSEKEASPIFCTSNAIHLLKDGSNKDDNEKPKWMRMKMKKEMKIKMNMGMRMKMGMRMGMAATMVV